MSQTLLVDGKGDLYEMPFGASVELLDLNIPHSVDAFGYSSPDPDIDHMPKIEYVRIPWCELSWLPGNMCHHCRTGARTLGPMKDEDEED